MALAAVLLASACGSGADCPYDDDPLTSFAYDTAHRKGTDLREIEEMLGGSHEYFPTQIGDRPLFDLIRGYKDGYFTGLVQAKFEQRRHVGTIDYPDLPAYVSGYAGGLESGYAFAMNLDLEQREALSAGFLDGYWSSECGD